MKNRKFGGIKKWMIALAVSGLLLSANAQAHDDYDYENDYAQRSVLDDVLLTVVPLLVYDALSEPRVIVRKRIVTQGRIKPRYSREHAKRGRHHRHHRPHRNKARSHSRGDYKYPVRGSYHGHF